MQKPNYCFCCYFLQIEEEDQETQQLSNAIPSYKLLH